MAAPAGRTGGSRQHESATPHLQAPSEQAEHALWLPAAMHPAAWDIAVSVPPARPPGQLVMPCTGIAHQNVICWDFCAGGCHQASSKVRSLLHDAMLEAQTQDCRAAMRQRQAALTSSSARAVLPGRRHWATALASRLALVWAATCTCSWSWPLHAAAAQLPSSCGRRLTSMISSADQQTLSHVIQLRGCSA